MKFKIQDIQAIEASYSVFNNYVMLPRTHTFEQKTLRKIDVKENSKYKLLRDCAENILMRRPERLNQFSTSTIDGILTFYDIALLVSNYTSAMRTVPIMRNDNNNYDVMWSDVDAYLLIVPLVLYVMMFNQQIEYYNCYYADMYSGNISIIADESHLEEIDILCNFFGYKLQLKRSVDNEVYAAGHPSLIEVSYVLVEIPGINLKTEERDN